VRQFFDSLLGRSRPAPSKIENMFAMSTAQIALETQLNLTPDTHAGIVFRPVDSAYFDQASQELNDLLKISTKDTGTIFETQTDHFGFRWILLSDPQFEDLVATIHIISQTLIEQQFGEQLLSAVFRYNTSEGKKVYWFYNYKRGAFYPFVPEASGRNRDNAFELRLTSAMEHELPIEKELERWYPMWDIPF
jgi:hypothetical protein